MSFELIIIIIIIILSFDIAPFPYKHAQRRITLHCQRIDVDIHIKLIDTYFFEQMCFQLSFEDCSQLPEYYFWELIP